MTYLQARGFAPLRQLTDLAVLSLTLRRKSYHVWTSRSAVSRPDSVIFSPPQTCPRPLVQRLLDGDHEAARPVDRGTAADASVGDAFGRTRGIAQSRVRRPLPMSWLTRQPEAAFCLRKPAILQALSRASLSAKREARETRRLRPFAAVNSPWFRFPG